MKLTAPVGKRRSTQLRMAVDGVRRGRTTPTRRRRDVELLSLVSDPYTSVDETHRRLEDLRVAFEERADRRAVFLSVYASMTDAVADHIDRGHFDDPEWVGAYLVTFANLYREAVYDYETGRYDALADSWHIAFDAAERGDSLVVQDAALGVNAHINYDLAVALERVGIDPNRKQKYADHKRVTDVIRAIVDDAQETLTARDAPGLETLDDSLGRIDEWLVVFSLDECRDSAWRTAVARQSRLTVRRRLARWFNDVTATGVAHVILASHADATVHESLSSLEASPPSHDET